MATFRLRHFSNPQTLRAIEPARLLQFLEPYRTYFASREYELPPADSTETLDYQALVNIFMSPDEKSPSELVDALFLVDEMSTPEAAHGLLEAGEHLSFDTRDEQSYADIAVQVWLLEREILERKHAQQFLFRPKSFEYYQSMLDIPPHFDVPTPDTRQRLENELDDWFESKKRGRNSRVLIYPNEHEVQILVRHGEPFKREESQVGTDVSSVCYRPIKYDTLVYDQLLGELRINAILVGEKKLYCERFGYYFFDNENHFPGKNKYTLQPLVEDGADSLATGDIDGIEWIRLVEVEFFWGGPYRARETKKAEDIFANLEDRQRHLPANGRIIKAVFRVKFDDSKTPRSVTVRPSNIAQYTRDHDAELIEKWLDLRKFIVHQRESEHGAVEQTLASS
jgi:hypothetical protein